jgi:hypothetical protein
VDPISYEGKAAAAEAAKRQTGAALDGVFAKLDATGVPGLTATEMRSAVQQAPGMVRLLNDPLEGRAAARQAEKLMGVFGETAPSTVGGDLAELSPEVRARVLARAGAGSPTSPEAPSPLSWSEASDRVSRLREYAQPALDKAARGGDLNLSDRVRIAAYQASRGSLQKAAEDAAERAGSPELGAQLASLRRDYALASAAHETVQDRMTAEAASKGLISNLATIHGIGVAAMGHPVAGAALVAKGLLGKQAVAAAPTLAAKASLAASRIGSSLGESGVAARTLRRVVTPLTARYPQPSGNLATDSLQAAALHAANQQSNHEYQRAVGKDHADPRNDEEDRNQ